MPYAGMDDFVIDQVMVDSVIWETIRSSPWLFWGENFDLRFKVETKGLNTDTYVRDGSWDRDNDRGGRYPDFVESSSGLRFVQSPGLAFVKGEVASINLAGIVATKVGAWFTFEFSEDAGEPAEADLVRIPAAPTVTDEIDDWIAEQPSGRIVHRGAVRIEERFGDVIDADPNPRLAEQLVDYHIAWDDIETEGQFEDQFAKIVDVTERSVRRFCDG